MWRLIVVLLACLLVAHCNCRSPLLRTWKTRDWVCWFVSNPSETKCASWQILVATKRLAEELKAIVVNLCNWLWENHGGRTQLGQVEALGSGAGWGIMVRRWDGRSIFYQNAIAANAWPCFLPKKILADWLIQTALRQSIRIYHLHPLDITLAAQARKPC